MLVLVGAETHLLEEARLVELVVDFFVEREIHERRLVGGGGRERAAVKVDVMRRS